MNDESRSPHSEGFSLIEVMVSFALVAGFVLASQFYLDSASKNTSLTRTISSRDRVLLGIRTLAAMPASLRNSMIASDGTGAPTNPYLLSCAGANTAAATCTNGQEQPLTLYAPIMMLDASGNPVGVQPITAPCTSANMALGGCTNPVRFDVYGAICTTSGPSCPLEVFTSMTPQCAPAAIPSPAPSASYSPLPIASMTPTATCTVADVIKVTYWVQLDPALATNYPSLAAFITPVSETAVTSVAAISGNLPQQ